MSSTPLTVPDHDNVVPLGPIGIISRAVADHAAVVQRLVPLHPMIAEIAARILASLRSGGKVLFMGNGGSASDAQHLAAELMGRFERERQALPAIALTTDTSILTAIANDYSYDQIFARQVQALARAGDVVVGISTSGNSVNVLRGLSAARELGAIVVGMTGKDGGRMRELCDLCLVAPADNTARIQETHILIGHIICDLVERGFVDSQVQPEEQELITNPLFEKKLAALFPGKTPSVVDLRAAGVEGTFDVVTAWDYVERLGREHLHRVCGQVGRRLIRGGLWIVSVAAESKDEWLRFFAAQGLVHHPDIVEYFGQDWPLVPGTVAAGGVRVHLALAPRGADRPALPYSPPYALGDVTRAALEFLKQGITTTDPELIRYSVALLDAAIANAPEHYDLHFARAVGHAKLGLVSDARSELATLLAVRPDHGPAGALLRQLGGV